MLLEKTVEPQIQLLVDSKRQRRKSEREWHWLDSNVWHIPVEAPPLPLKLPWPGLPHHIRIPPCPRSFPLRLWSKVLAPFLPVPGRNSQCQLSRSYLTSVPAFALWISKHSQYSQHYLPNASDPGDPFNLLLLFLYFTYWGGAWFKALCAVRWHRFVLHVQDQRMWQLQQANN